MLLIGANQSFHLKTNAQEDMLHNHGLQNIQKLHPNMYRCKHCAIRLHLVRVVLANGKPDRVFQRGILRRLHAGVYPESYSLAR